MTRFKEPRRIEHAIKYHNEAELLWAKKYCESRLSWTTMKEHRKHWSKLLRRIEDVLEREDT